MKNKVCITHLETHGQLIMIDFLFVILFFLIPIIAYYLMKLAGINLFQFSIPSFVMSAILVFAYAGILPLYFGWDEYRYDLGVQDQGIILKMFACSSWTIIAMIFGFIFSKHAFNLRILQNSSNFNCLTRKETVLTGTLFVLCLSVLALYLSKLQSIALVAVLNNAGAGEIGAARSLMGNDFAGKYHWYSVFMRDGLNVVTFAFYANWLLKKGKGKVSLLLFIVSFIAASFSAIMASEKSPFAWLLIGLFLVHVIVVSRGKYPIKTLLLLVLGILGFLVLFYIYFMGSTEISSALLSLLSRAITGGIDPAYFYLAHFPDVEDFLLGKSLPNPGGILPFEPYHLTKEASLWMIPEYALKGIVGSAPTVFWGELYANWDMYGVIFVPFIVGIVLFTLNSLVDKLKNNPLKVGLVVWLALHYKNLSESGISEFLVDTYLIIVVSLVIVATTLANNGHLKFSR